MSVFALWHKKYNRLDFARNLMPPSALRRFIVILVICLLLFVSLLDPYNCKQIYSTPKVEYVCIEDPTDNNATGLENVKPLHIFSNEDTKSHVVDKEQLYKPTRKSFHFSPFEKKKIRLCVKNYPTDFLKGREGFWSGTQQEIRRTHHTYLVPGKSVIIDVGGNVGDDAQVFLDTYKPKHYIMLEPLKLLYRRLLLRFQNYTNVISYNFGLGARYEQFMIKIEGNEGDASSIFLGSGEGTCSIKVVNAIDFFIKLAVKNYKIDLITINCEGCEYDLLETLLSTDFIYQFKHIQFGTHSKLRNLPDPVNRYCQLQELLCRSHELTYQYKFQWETWKLKNV